jgi:Holliday junction resolvasome RuvABC endonuclease subunit
MGNIIGIDPSVTSCGIVVIDFSKKVLLAQNFGYTLNHASELDKIKRSLEIIQQIIGIGKKMDCDYIAVEGLGISPKNGRMGNQYILAEFLGILKSQILLALKTIPEIVPPPSWKKCVIGNGRADKLTIKKVLESKGYKFDTQDMYDALGIALYIRSQKSYIID